MAIPLMLPLPLTLYLLHLFSPFFPSLSLARACTQPHVRASVSPFPSLSSLSLPFLSGSSFRHFSASHGLEGAREANDAGRALLFARENAIIDERSFVPNKSIFFSFPFLRGMGNSMGIDGRSFFFNLPGCCHLSVFRFFSLQLSLTNVLTTMNFPNFLQGAGFLLWFFNPRFLG